MNQDVENQIGGYENLKLTSEEAYRMSQDGVGITYAHVACSKLDELQRKADMADELAEALEDLLNSCVVKHPQIKTNARIRLANYRGQL